VVYDSKLCITASLVANLSLCRRLGLPNTQQMVLHFPRNLQRGHILVPRTIQGIGLCVQSYSLLGFVDHRINWTGIEEETGTSYTEKDSLSFPFYTDCISIIRQA